MDSILRGLVVYLFLLVVFRLAGRRTLSEMTSFDLIILLIISETTEQALLGEDASVTGCFLVVMTLVVLDIGFSLVKQWSKRIGRVLDGIPTVIVEDGRPLKDLMNRCRVDEGDVLESARELQGLERMEQIRYAILERSGTITIIPKAGAR